MGYRKVKISVDGQDQCGKDCPFLRLDVQTGSVQCTLFVDVLRVKQDEPRLVTVAGTEPKPKEITIYRAEACKAMEEL